MYLRIFGLGAAATLMLSSCAGVDSRPRVISERGVDPLVREHAATYDKSLVRLFYDTAILAYPASVTTTPDTDVQYLFLDRGFRLIKERCRLYLGGKANRQRSLNVWRATFAPITALLTGTVALTSKGDTVDTDLVTGLGLATTAAGAGFEIYEEQFLFGAKNIGSVTTLIENALDTDSKAKLGEDQTTFTYAKSVDWLSDNQQICHPEHILLLVEDAIKNGRLVSTRKPDGSEGPGDPPAGEPAGVRIAPL